MEMLLIVALLIFVAYQMMQPKLNVPKTMSAFHIDPVLVRRGKPYLGTLESMCRKYGFEPAMIVAQGIIESALDPTAIGDNGKSKGIMQIQEAAWNEGSLYIGRSNNNYDQCWNSQYINFEVAIGYHLCNAKRANVTDGGFLLRAYNQGIGGSNNTAAKEYERRVWAYYHELKRQRET